MTSESSTMREESHDHLSPALGATKEEPVLPPAIEEQIEAQRRQDLEEDLNLPLTKDKDGSQGPPMAGTASADPQSEEGAASKSVASAIEEERSTTDEVQQQSVISIQDGEEASQRLDSALRDQRGSEQAPEKSIPYQSSTFADVEDSRPDTPIDNSKASKVGSVADKGAEEATTTGKRDGETTPQRIVSTAATAAPHRELPPPPTPSKEEEKSLSSNKAEMTQVAKAFGVGLKVSDHSKDGMQSSAQTASMDRSTELGSVTSSIESPKTPRSGGLKIGKGPPPTTQASEEKPFDFNRFLDQMRHKSAGPVGEYVRSFIKGFTKKPYRVSDQTKLIFDFLDFISHRMRECEVWSKLNSTEFENATEAMEKLLMNRLYNFTFSPAVRKEGKWNVQTDDLERDRVLKQRIRLFSWISEEHLDVPTGSNSKGFVDFAIEELLKINHYKAPRDKVICILNCCKVIFGLIRHLSSEENADTFIPILIFVVLRSNPDHLISNVEYISRFRNPEKLSSESGYYLSSLMGAVAFIETMDCTSLSNITQEQFEANVESAVEKMSAQPDSIESSPRRPNQVDFTGEKEELQSGGEQSSTLTTVQGSSSSGEESARSLPMSAGAAALAEDTKAFFQRTGEAARAGIGASIGKPMGALGRLFQESLEGPRTPGGTSPLPASGRATPEIPTVTAAVGSTTTTSSSARSRMWGLFGVDGDETQSKQQSSAPPRSISSSSSLNFGNWSRSMREEEEDPHTPVSEELRQGRFANLLDRSQPLQTPLEPSLQHQLGNAAPRAQRQQRRIPQRTDSMDPYSINDEDGNMASGVRTPDGDGSDVDISSPTHATAASRSRFTDLSGFMPRFLSEQNSAQSTQQTFNPPPLQQSQPNHGQLDSEEAAIATAQIEQAHLAAGVETLKSIFPDVDPSVCRLVLEDCQGDLRKTIDKLLEM